MMDVDAPISTLILDLLEQVARVEGDRDSLTDSLTDFPLTKIPPLGGAELLPLVMKVVVVVDTLVDPAPRTAAAWEVEAVRI